MTFGLKNRKCLRFFPYLVTISGAQKKRKIWGWFNDCQQRVMLE